MRIILAFIISFNFSYGQTYKAEYDMYGHALINKRFEATLFFDAFNSMFKYHFPDLQETQEVDEGFETYSFSENDFVIYADKKSKKLYEKNYLFDEGDYFTEEKTFKLKWVLVDEKKNIGSFECFKAKTKFRGREYTAWYTISVPVSFGPWKLNGLPGLIVEATDESGLVQFRLKKIETINVKNVDLKLPSTVETKSLISHVKKNNQLFKKKVAKMKARNDRDGSVAELTFNAIEINYYDLEKGLKIW